MRKNPAIAWAWARGQVRQLEDDYVVGGKDQRKLERQIVETSLRFGVLSRFTAYVAVDGEEVINPGGVTQRVTQAVEAPAMWAAASLSCNYMKIDDDAKLTGSFRPSGSRSLLRRGGDILPSLKQTSLDFLRSALRRTGPGDAEASQDRKAGKSRGAESQAAPNEGLPPALPSAPLREAASRLLVEHRDLAKKEQREKQAWFIKLGVELAEWLEGLTRQKTDEAHLTRLKALIERLAKLLESFVGGNQVFSPEVLDELGAETEAVLTALAGEEPGGGEGSKPRQGFWK